MEIIVSAGHGEYGNLGAPCVEELWSPHDEPAWSALNAADDAHLEDTARDLFTRRTGLSASSEIDYTWENVIRLRGDRMELQAWYDALAADVSNGPQGGDDDTFDYWPSGVRLARDVADALGGDLRERLDAVIAEAVSESGFDAEELGV